MGRAKPVVLGGRVFPRQLDAIVHFSAILKATAVGVKIVDPVERNDLIALLERHRDRSEKVGSGIDYFTTMLSSEGSKCFAIRRTDGSLVDFSFHRCIKQDW